MSAWPCRPSKAPRSSGTTYVPTAAATTTRCIMARRCAPATRRSSRSGSGGRARSAREFGGALRLHGLVNDVGETQRAWPCVLAVGIDEIELAHAFRAFAQWQRLQRPPL